MGLDRLGDRRPRLGLGLAAVGRPGYINLGHAHDLPAERTVEALRARSHQLLDVAYERGVRYFDVARSYGRAEEFLAGWLDGHPDAVVGSKWGYTYTAGWRVDAEVHERKDHSVATFVRQLAETRALLGERLDLYQIHSLTPDSTALTDAGLHRRLADLAATGVTVGLSTSGPRQGEAIRAALDVEVDGEPLFTSVQSTWNVLEQSAGPALTEAHQRHRFVIVKEAMANGRLAGDDAPPLLRDLAGQFGVGVDAIALGLVLSQPWVDVVLSGAATVDQLTANLAALPVPLENPDLRELAERAGDYWSHRSSLPWQ